MLLTANLFPMLCLSVASVLNTVAIAYHSLAAVPFFYIVAVMLLWICVSCPLCLLGTVGPQPRPPQHRVRMYWGVDHWSTCSRMRTYVISACLALPQPTSPQETMPH